VLGGEAHRFIAAAGDGDDFDVRDTAQQPAEPARTRP
jgi:hypothetical protein